MMTAKQRKLIIIGSSIAGVLLLILLCVWIWFCVQRSKWTSEAPKEVPVVTVTDKDKKDVLQKYRKIRASIEHSKSCRMELKGEQLNMLIALLEEFAPYRGKVGLEVKDNIVIAELSVPLTNIPLMSGRYLVGKFDMSVSVKDGELTATVQRGTVNGNEATEWMIQKLNDKLALPENKTKVQSGWFKQIRNLEVEGGKVWFETWNEVR